MDEITNIDSLSETELAEEELEEQSLEIVSSWKVVVLSVLTVGLYEAYWMYKSWKFFKEKDGIEVTPVARAILSIFFLPNLFKRIEDFAEQEGYESPFPAIICYIAYFALNFTSGLGDFYWLWSFAAVFCLVPAIDSLNFALEQNDEISTFQQEGFNTRQKWLIVVCLLLWGLIIYSFSGNNSSSTFDDSPLAI